MSSRDGKPSGRLPTFKARRDLTLGNRSMPNIGASSLGNRNRQILLGSGSALTKTGVSSSLSSNVNNVNISGDASTKKKFTPNLNVPRKQPSGETSCKIKPEQSKSGQFRRGQEFGSPSKRNQRKPFQRPELIQTMGSVFSEGIGEIQGGIRRPKYGSGLSSYKSCDRETKVNMQKPKLNLNINVDKEDEAKRLQELLRDDFIDDLTQGPLVPVQLPMIDTGTAFKEENKDHIAGNEDVKGEKSKKSFFALDSDDDSDAGENITENIKPDPEKSFSKKSVIGKYSPSKKSENRASKLSFPDLVRMQKGDLLFVQLPDHLPINLPLNNEAVKQEELLPAISNVENVKIENGLNDITEALPKCTLNTLPEGYLGKIQIRKSGKTQLLIGDTALDVDLGAQVGFLQDLVSINVATSETESKDPNHCPKQVKRDMTVLGHVRHRVVVSPDWEHLFNLCEKQHKANSGNHPLNDSSDTSEDDIYNDKIG